MILNNIDFKDFGFRSNIKWDIRGDYERQLIEEIGFNESLRNVFDSKFDLTEDVLKTLWYKTHGERPDHFVVIIRGLPGITSTGVGKSSFAQILGKIYSDVPFTADMIGFTNDEILDIVEKKAVVTEPGKEISQVFIRDETPESLKRRAEAEASIMIDSLRESKISIILVKPAGIEIETAHYVFVPIAFSKNFDFIKVAVYNFNKDYYRGYIVVPLTPNDSVWTDYKLRKKEYQKKVTGRTTSGFDHKVYCVEFINKHKNAIRGCIKTRKGDGSIYLDTKRIGKYINDTYSNFTNEERKYIVDDLQELMENEMLYKLLGMDEIKIEDLEIKEELPKENTNRVKKPEGDDGMEETEDDF